MMPTMVRAKWNGAVLAESDATRVVEGNHYFPLAAVKKEFLRRVTRTRRVVGRASPATTTSRWAAK